MPLVKTVKNETDVIVPKAGETYVSEDGTVSQVLDDHIDANYEPTEEEVLEFADWIGMKLPEDSDYLWLAREGLKTPLPKEWKPCSTNDGEVYYFNFKTGESSWDHPMDSLFRQRFEQEKEKARKGEKSTPASATGKMMATASSNSRSSSGLRTSSPAGTILQSRVIITDMGTTTRATGSAAGFTSTATASTTTASDPSRGNHGAPEKSSNSGKPATQTTSPHPQQSKSSAAAPLLAPRRIVSEAERAMEEKVEREVQLSLEEAKSKLAEAHQATLTSLQQLHDKDIAGMRAADEARRAAVTKQEDEERQRRLQQTGEKCEELYGDELRTMEREEEVLKSKLQKMEAEAARAASGNTQRIQIEEQMQSALAKQRADLEASMKRQHDAAMTAEETEHTAATQKIARECQEKVKAVQQASLRKMDAMERTMALEVDRQRKTLEQELKSLEQKLAERAKASAITGANSTAAGAVATSAPSPSLSEELARISSAKAAQLRTLENDAKKERDAVQAEGEAAIAELSRQTQQRLAPGGARDTPSSRTALLSGDRPMPVVVQGGSLAGPRQASATLSVAYTQELNRIRMTRAKERQERLAQLRVERDAAVAAASVAPAHHLELSGQRGSASRSGSDVLATPTLNDLKTAHAEELEAKKTLYSRLEAELKEQLAQEASAAAAATTSEQQSAMITKAVEAEMALYMQEAEARYARMRLEADAKREKLLADHQLALEAYERKKKEIEARQAREEQEAKEAFIQEKVEAAVKAETAKLEAEHATAMARLTSRYEEERGTAKEEVDEEIDAYEQAERQKIINTTAASVSAAQLPTQPTAQPSSSSAALPYSSNDDAATAAAVAPIEARCVQLSQQLGEREAQWAAEKARLDTRRKDLDAKRTTMLAQQQHHEQHLKAVKDENFRLATSLSAAETQRDSARMSALTTSPSALLPAATSLHLPPSGYRLRTAHEAALLAIEDGYRAEQSALEEDLQNWRSKVQRLLQDRQRRSSQSGPLSTGLHTPRHQVFPNPGSEGVATAAGNSHRTPILPHPSPIALTAAGASLQNTPLFSFPFGDSPLGQPQPLQRSATPSAATAAFGQPPLAGAGVQLYSNGPFLSSNPAPSVELSLTAPTARDALSYSREHQQSMLQRQAALLVAREAWQQQRSRELQQLQMQQVQRSLPLPPSPSAAVPFSNQGDHGSVGLRQSRHDRTLIPQRQPSPRQQDQLSLVLSKLSSRLDSLTGQAEQLQRHRCQSKHADPHPTAREKETGEAGSASRSHLTRSRRHKSARHQRQCQATAASPPAPRKSSRSPDTTRQSSSRRDDDILSSKWNQLLSKYDRR
ncbi:hypothetical protein ABL78_7049 [Leptomonas seymouri]|uniref:WW domain-containing protein n=1 Tax=Leptomonas seymouri TaxID=5684 RepID=A0A0N1IIB5_LEPSE|nr:hypothetical protein ABL78_7049 [Leptomonas seymouri]|eukprot:KPI83913.1 hypothetical protein ABL78_7049 [Leptomonas seymouri]